jgi:hypothetical protein
MYIHLANPLVIKRELSLEKGAVSLSLLTPWSPVLTIKSALLATEALLTAPEPSSVQDDNLRCTTTNLGSELTEANYGYDGYLNFFKPHAAEIQHHPTSIGNESSSAGEHPWERMASIPTNPLPPPGFDAKHANHAAGKPYDSSGSFFEGAVQDFMQGRTYMSNRCDRCRTMKATVSH